MIGSRNPACNEDAEREGNRRCAGERLNMRKALIGAASVLTVGLAGCSANTEGWKVTAAQEICAQRGGIDHMNNFLGTGVVCRDGFFSETKSKP